MKKRHGNSDEVKETDSPSALIDAKIQELSDWRGKMLGRVRKLIRQADPEVVEEWKWKGVPVWSHGGIICTGETYKAIVKLTFAKGASLADPSGLFSSGLEGNIRRAIDIHEGDKLDEKAFKELIRKAAALNTALKKMPDKKKTRSTDQSAKVTKKATANGTAAKPVLLSGGNPRIARADGDAPVQTYISAMPGWKGDVGRLLDELIVRTVPDVRKAVKWNTPFYGVEGRGWFVGFHCVTKYVKVAFFRGTLLSPLPPVESKQKDVRYLHIHEHEELAEAQFMSWIKQAAALPGWLP